MQNSVHKQARKYLRRHKRWKKWQKIVTTLSCIVVFCTVYALILPAITARSETSCGYEEHTHKDSCYKKELICKLEAESEEHAHSEACMGYEKTLVCGQAETEGHTHGEACYIKEEINICGLEENETHAHDASCYQEIETQICGLQESAAHVHGESCYEEISTYVCGMEEGQKTEKHKHTDKCYNSVKKCEKEEHEHKLACFSDPNADVETAEVWKRTFDDVELTGNWSEDLIAIAESQLGYVESTENYIVDEDGDKKGYSRYGDWYGDTYGHWCAMFVSFCLNYAEIPETEIPYEANCQKWVDKLTKLDMYMEMDEYLPEPGDLIFYDKTPSDAKISNHIGIVKEVIVEEGKTTQVKAIEGNASNQVKYVTYDIDDKEILGYGLLPENKNLSKEMVELVQETELFTATATFEEGVLPEKTELKVELLKNAEEEKALESYVQEEGKELLLSQYLGIDFQEKSGNSVEPDGDVRFRIQFNEPVAADETLTQEAEDENTESTSTEWMLYRISDSTEISAVSGEDVSLTETGENEALQTAAFAYEPAAAYAVAAVAADAITVNDFATLKSQIENGTAEVIELKLGSDFSTTSGAIVINGKTVVLDLAGRTITANNGTVFDVVGGGSLTIKDSSFTEGHVSQETLANANVCGNLATYENDVLTYYVTVPSTPDRNTGATIETLQKYTVQIQGKIKAGTNNAIYVAGENSSFTLESGAIVAGTKRAIYQVDGTLNLAGGYICGFKTVDDGGAIQSDNSQVNLTGTVLAANSTDGRGGAIWIRETNLLIKDSAVISGNLSTPDGESGEWGAHYGGGGIYCSGDSSTITMDGGYITNNVSNATGYFDGGGGILISSKAKLYLIDGCITGNKANSGGGIRTNWQNGAFVSMTGGYVCSNHAYSGEGGGISINMGASAQLLAGYVNNNSIGQSNHWGGGGVFCSNGSKIYMLNALITGNRAQGFGGGVAGCSTGRVYIAVKNGGAIYDNIADGSGEHLSGDTSTKNEDHALAFNNEVFMKNGYRDYFCALASTVDGGMLGGYPANWKGSVDGRPVSTKADETLVASSIMGLTAHPTDIGKGAAQTAARLFINGNLSYTHGGGVLANGYLMIGEVGDIDVSARIELSGTKEYLDETGAVLPMEEGQFEFVLSDAKTLTPVTTATNDINGNIIFKDRLPFSEAGVYQYLLTESDPEDTTVTKDTSIYRITVRVGSKTTEGWGIGPGLVEGELVDVKFDMTQYLIENVLIEKKNGENDTEWEEIYNQDPGDSETSAIQIPITSNETFTNYNFESTRIKVIKNWIGENEGHNSIEVTLYQNEKVFDTVELNAANGWSYSWDQLPINAEDGKQYQYRVEEAAVAGYIPTYETITNVATTHYWVPATTLEAGKKYIIATPDSKAAMVVPTAHEFFVAGDQEPVTQQTAELKIGEKTYRDYYLNEDIVAESIFVAKSGSTNKVTSAKAGGRLKLLNEATSLALLIQKNESGSSYLKTSTGFSSGYVSLFEPNVSNGLYGHFEWYLTDDNSDNYRIYYTGDAFNAQAVSAGKVGTAMSGNVKLYTRVAGPVKDKEIIYVITNEKAENITYGLDVTKVSSDDENVTLKGAEFVLKDANGNILNFLPVKTSGAYTYSVQASNETTTKLVTDSLGKLVLTGLPAGKYTLEETKAPTGYKVAAPQEVVLGEDITNPTLKIKVVDYREDEFIMPETGGIGTNKFTIGGLLLMMSSLLLGVTVKRQRERRMR